ncbi:MAG: hypothetical protein AB7O91_01920 [Sphingomonas sp.]
MRSETAPMWVGFLLGLGIALIAVAVVAIARGNMKIIGNLHVDREAQPGAFWGIVIGSVVVGAGALAYAVPHFGPGG